jgi:hypothetical protein
MLDWLQGVCPWVRRRRPVASWSESWYCLNNGFDLDTGIHPMLRLRERRGAVLGLLTLQEIATRHAPCKMIQNPQKNKIHRYLDVPI